MGSTSWIDCGTYFLSTNPQGTDAWKEDRLGRLSASQHGHLILPKHKSYQQLADEILGVREDKFSDVAQEWVNHGSLTEGLARDWYTKVTTNEVIQVGFAVPKWCKEIGGSPDGMIGQDGLIEIKCPKKMYWSLMYKMKGIRMDTPQSFGFSSSVQLTPKNKEGEYDTCPISLKCPHILITHYAQMQSCMAITGRKWCDYVVYATESGQAYIERVYYDNDFWLYLYDQIQKFLNSFLPKRRDELIASGKIDVFPLV